MIFIAIVLFVVGFYLPYWISKKSVSESRQEISWKQALFELSGLLTCLVLSFVLSSITIFSSGKKYLLNKDVLFGIEGNELIEKWGFMDGDKIIRINGEEVVKFSDITLTLINSDKDPIVDIQRNGASKTITLNSISLISELIDANMPTGPFAPKNKEQLEYTQTSGRLSDVFNSYQSQIRLFAQFLPFSEKPYGGYLSIGEIKDYRGYSFLLSSCLLLLVFISLLPLPGFNLGNSLIVIIQKVSKRQYDPKRLKRLRRIFQSVFVVFILLSIITIYFE